MTSTYTAQPGSTNGRVVSIRTAQSAAENAHHTQLASLAIANAEKLDSTQLQLRAAKQEAQQLRATLHDSWLVNTKLVADKQAMKDWLLTAACIVFFLIAMFVVPTARAGEILDTVGVHTVSWHSGAGYNNRNPGLYATFNVPTVTEATGAKLAIGTYVNSYYRRSHYVAAAWALPWQISGLQGDVALSVGAVRGYGWHDETRVEQIKITNSCKRDLPCFSNTTTTIEQPYTVRVADGGLKPLFMPSAAVQLSAHSFVRITGTPRIGNKQVAFAHLMFEVKL